MFMMRKPRESKRWPDRIAVLAEAIDASGKPIFWGLRVIGENDSGGAHEGVIGNCEGSLAEMLGLLSDEPGDLLIIANNAYSVLTNWGFWDAIERGDLRLAGSDGRQGLASKCIVENPPTVIQCRPPGGSDITICDCANWGFEMPKRDLGFTAEVERSLESLSSFMVDRVVYQLDRLAEFARRYEQLLFDAHLGESWRCTAGSQASYGFRRNYMECPLELPDGSEDEKLVEHALYGGRCECRVVGEVEGPVYQYDARQLYSAAAAMIQCPSRMLCRIEPNGYCVDNWHLPSQCIADVELDTPKPCYPYRATQPDSRKKSEITIWPIGQFRTVLCGLELQLAVECKHVKFIHSAYRYVCSFFLKNWAETMWRERNRRQGPMAGVCKKIALSLYGRFAQRRREWIPDPCGTPPRDVLVGDWYSLAADKSVVRHRVLGGECSVERREGFTQQSCPAISAWITSAGRMMLQNFIDTADEVYYYDTDSVWTGQRGKARLETAGLIGDGLGQLKLEGEYERVHFFGIKDYQVEAVRTKAGVPAHAVQTSSGKWIWTEQSGFASHMSHHEYPRTNIVAKWLTARRDYRHGIVDDSGTVSPHNLSRSKSV